MIQRISWMGAPALFAGGAAGVVVAGRQLSQQGEEDRGLSVGDIFIGLGVGAAATVGTLATASRIGSAGRPPAGRAASIVLGGVIGSFVGVGAGMGVAALRGSQQAARRDERIDAANERLHDRVKHTPDESTSWSVDGARETSGWGTIATGAAALTGAGIGMQLRRVASGSPARVALGALGLLAGGVGAGAGVRELLLRRGDETVHEQVSSPVAAVPANPPSTGKVQRPELEPGDVVVNADTFNGDTYDLRPLRFVEWATDRSYATEAEARDAFAGVAPHGWSIDGKIEDLGYGVEVDHRVDSIAVFKDNAGYHLAFVKDDEESVTPTKVAKDEGFDPVYAEALNRQRVYEFEHASPGWREREWDRSTLTSFEPMPLEYKQDDETVTRFREEFVEPALAAGAEGYGYVDEQVAVAKMRELPGDQQVVEVSPVTGDHEYDSIDLVGPRYFVIEPDPLRDARRQHGIRAVDEQVDWSIDYDELSFHQRDVAREVDGVEMTAHDGWFLTPGKVTDGTFD